MKILAIDVGKARTGIAMSDKNEVLASPVCVIFERNPEHLALKITEVIIENNADIVVFGLPKNMDNSEGDSALYVREFAGKIASNITCPIDFYDERLSTVTAHRYLNHTNVRGGSRKKVVDAVAATVILQSYLDYRKNSNQKSECK